MVAMKALEPDRVEARLVPRLGRHEGPSGRAARQAVRRHGAHVGGDERLDETHAAERPHRPRRPRRLPRHGRRRRLVARLGEGASGASVSAALSPRRVARPARPDEGLADLHRRRARCRRFDPADLAARRSAGSSSSRSTLSYDELLRAAEGRAGLDLPLRHRLDGEERPLGRRAAPRRARAARSRSREAHALRVRLGRAAVRRLPDARSRPALHDVMLAYEMDGKPLPREHGAPAAARDPGDVRLQERQVAEADRARPGRPSAATGSSSATTATPGSAARTGTAS